MYHMFSVSHLYFISHRWVHFFCTHLSVTFLYMCLLKSLFFIVTETDFLFLCVADCFGVFLTMWSVESQILTSGLADDLLLFVHDFISFIFISSDKYICWQEVTIKPSWNFTSLNSFSLMFVIMNFHRYMRKSTPPRKIQRFEFTL